jgi:phosphoribosylformylglycinamidine (FGAM) synthase PurS component
MTDVNAEPITGSITLSVLPQDTVERSDSGEAIPKHYHVILHYERIAEEESKFEAMYNTIMGNTVVENAKISAIAIDPDLPIDLLNRGWD